MTISPLLVLMTVVLPAFAIVIEVVMRICADTFFDPLPSIGHVFVVAVVPLANAFSVRALRRQSADRLGAVIFAQAFAVAVAAVYTLLFLPLVPLALVAVILLGLGLLALAPALSLAGSVWLLLQLRRMRAARGLSAWRTLAGGLVVGVGALLVLQLPVALTRVMMAAAASDDPSTRTTGLTWLRRLGHRELMRRACTQRPTAANDLLSVLVNVAASVPPDKMREIYYRVTGRPFDADAVAGDEDRPPLALLPWSQVSQRDQLQGGGEVGVAALSGVSLASSRIDGSVDGGAALAYLEWTFEFRNNADVDREARAEVALPPGGVVSRVTLWVDGQEREASFASRDTTRRAYERVVRARRDPILVTTTAPDRVLIQCFPVPRNGGVMKARVGITTPLQLTGRERGVLVLPFFTQRNFAVPAEIGHAIWLASAAQFAAPAAPLSLAPAPGSKGGQVIRGVVAEPAQPGPFASIAVPRAPTATRAFAADHRGETRASSEAVVIQTVESDPLPALARLVVVIDGSASMEAAARGIEAALAALPRTAPRAVIVAGDVPQDLLGGVRTLERGANAVLTDARFAGGADSLPALLTAWDLAAVVPGGAVLWIHGPQPLLLGSPAPLLQRLERQRHQPPVYTYAAVGGQNHLLAAIGGTPGVAAVPRFTMDSSDLQQFVRQLSGGEPRLRAVRTRAASGAGAADGGVATSDHLARLWAHDRIAALLRGGRDRPPTAAERAEALALASRYHLVTAVSGAVVLDTDAATVAAGLEPGNADNVPTVPEPETWALLILLAATLLWAMVQRRRYGGLPRAV